MQLRAIRQLHLRGLRQRPARAALAVASVGAGVALAVGVVITYLSLQQSIGSFTTSISGHATLRVQSTSDHGALDQSALPRIAAARGVKAAVPLVLTVVEAADGHGDVSFVPVLGITCAIEEVVGPIGCQQAALDRLTGPVLGPALHDRLGRDGTLRTDLGEHAVGAAPVLQPLSAINDGVVAVYPLALAQRELARPDGLDAILVVPERGTDAARLRTAVERAAGPGSRVLDASTSLPGSLVAALILPVLLLLSFIGMAIGAQLVRNTLELTLEERRRELATGSALGASPRHVLTGILAEGTVLGLLGGAVGIGLGSLIAHAVVRSIADQVERTATGVHLAVTVDGTALVLGLAIGLGVCLAAALGPARRAARRELTTELSQRARHQPPEPGARRASALITFGGLALSLLAAELAHRDGAIGPWQQPTLLVSVSLIALLTFRVPGLLAAPGLRLVARLPAFRSGPGRVAVDTLLSTPKRTASIAMAIGAPVVLAAAIGSIVPAIGTGTESVTRAASGGRVYVSTIGTTNTASVDSKLPPDLEARVAAIPGAGRVERWYYVSVDHPLHGPLEIDAMDGQAPDYHVYRGASGAEAFADGKVMIGSGLARARGLRVGDVVTMPGRYGDVALAIGGIWASPTSIGRSITMPGAVMRRITGPRPPEWIQIWPDAGTTATQLAERIRGAHLDPRLIVFDPAQLAANNDDEYSSLAAPFEAMQRGVLLVALVATASTLLLSSIQRRREVGVLAALGMSPRDLARATLTETLLVSLVAGAVAVVASQLIAVSFCWASEVATAVPIPYAPRFGAFPVAILTATAVALAGAILPAWRAAAVDPVVTLREA